MQCFQIVLSITDFFKQNTIGITGTPIRCLVVGFFQLQIEREVNQKGIVVKRQRLI